MRLVTFVSGGVNRVGVLISDNRVAAAGMLPEGVTTLKGVLAASGIDGLRGIVASETEVWDLDDVQLAPPVPDPGKIICVGVNYRAHRAETNNVENPYPTIFTRFADTQIPHGAQAVRPAVTDQFDYEGELAVVIGLRANRVAVEDAWDHVAGLSVYNDFTARDWQKHSTQWLPGKNFPGTGAFGPALVTLDEVPHLESEVLTTRVNGEARQKAELSDLIFNIPALISYVSTFTRLLPGDVIVTGTPGGVGKFMTPPTFLEEGDEVEVEITGVGVLRNRVAGHSLASHG